MSKIAKVKLSEIAINPYRQLSTYPFIDNKLKMLERSISDVGLWPGIIVRPKKGGGWEQAFGTHRAQAARNVLGEDAEIEVIVADLSDEDMVRYMGRENGEDYSTDFLILLETWEAAEAFLSKETSPERTDIARFIGWTRQHPQRDVDMVSNAAAACASASELLKGGYFKRSELAGLNVTQAREITERVVGLQREAERAGKVHGHTAEQIQRDKKIAAGAGKLTADRVRSGHVASKEIRTKVGSYAYSVSRSVERRKPMFDVFAKVLADQMNRLAVDDSIGQKLADVVKALRADKGKLAEQDMRFVSALVTQCEIVSERFYEWKEKLERPGKPAAKPVVKQLTRRAS